METMDYLCNDEINNEINNQINSDINNEINNINDDNFENIDNYKSGFYNDINNEELNFIRVTIESMSKFNQIEVLRILQKCKEVTLSENKYGVHINLSEVKKEIIDELKTFINYVNTQEMNLHKLEEQKEKFKNTYFTKDNKDIKSISSKIKINV